MPIESQEQAQAVAKALRAGAITDPQKRQAALDQLRAFKDSQTAQLPDTTAATQTAQDGPGLVEGAGRMIVGGMEALVNGVLDRGAEVADFADRVTGRMTPEEIGEAKVLRRLQSLERRERREAAGGLPVGATGFFEGVGSFAPDIFAGSRLGKIPDAWGRIGAETAYSAATTAASQADRDDMISYMATGGAVGAGMATLFEIPSFIAGRRLGRLRDVRASSTFEEAQRVADAFGVDLTIAESTGEQWAKQLESAVPESFVPGSPGFKKAQFYQNRAQQVLEGFAREVDVLTEGADPTAITRRVQTAVNRNRDNLRAARRDAYRSALRDLAPSVDATVTEGGDIIGGRKIVSPDTLVREYDRQIALLQDTPGKIDPAEVNSLQRVRDQLARVAENGGMDLGQVQRLVSQLSGDTAPKGSLPSQLQQAQSQLQSSRLLEAFEQDMLEGGGAQVPVRQAPIQDGQFRSLDEVDVDPTLQPATEDVTEGLQRANDLYRSMTQPINELDRRVANRLIHNLENAGPDAMADALLSMPTSELKFAFQAVEAGGVDPKYLRGQLWGRLLSKHTSSTKTGPAATSGPLQRRLDVKGVLRDLEKQGDDRLQTLLGSTNSEGLTNGVKVLKAIRNLGPEGMNLLVKDGSIAEQGLDEIVRGNITGGIPIGLVSRVVRMELGPAELERILFTEQGHKILTYLGKPRRTAGAVAAASALNQVLAGAEADREAALRLAAQQQQANDPEARKRFEESQQNIIEGQVF